MAKTKLTLDDELKKAIKASDHYIGSGIGCHAQLIKNQALIMRVLLNMRRAK